MQSWKIHRKRTFRRLITHPSNNVETKYWIFYAWNMFFQFCGCVTPSAGAHSRHVVSEFCPFPPSRYPNWIFFFVERFVFMMCFMWISLAPRAECELIYLQLFAQSPINIICQSIVWALIYFRLFAFRFGFHCGRTMQWRGNSLRTFETRAQLHLEK